MLFLGMVTPLCARHGTRVIDNRFNRIVVDEAKFLAIDAEPGSGIGLEDHPIALLTVRSGRELVFSASLSMSGMMIPPSDFSFGEGIATRSL
jgi:hypothetical protein